MWQRLTSVRLRVAEALRVGRVAAENAHAASVAIFADLTLSEGGKNVRSSEVAYRTILEAEIAAMRLQRPSRPPTQRHIEKNALPSRDG